MPTPPKTVKQRVGQVIKPVVRATGYELVKHHFYSALPDVKALPESLWTEPKKLVGIDLRLDAAVSLMQRELQPFLSEFNPTHQPRQPGEFYLDNGTYGSVDAEILYGMIRFIKPKRLIELGSGASSYVIAAAARANSLQSSPLKHTIFDPYPFTASPFRVESGVEVRATRAENIDASEIEMLGDGDVMFVDTTHTVKTGGDVTRVILDLIPRVARGTWIHVHDIFLPYEYPRHWVVDLRRAWAEQYVLQAFLAFNCEFEVIFPAHAVARSDPSALAGAIPSFVDRTFDPSAFWMRRR